jgi:cation diffusion facilitator family transporter
MMPEGGANLRAGRRVALAGICSSAVLSALNIAVGLQVQSTAILSAGMEFGGDVLASGVVLLGLAGAARPADAEHPYGHGRIETLAAFVVGMILAAGGVGICWNSLRGVGEQHPAPSTLAIGVLVAAIGIRAAMSLLKFRIGRRIRSESLVADAWNDTVDIIAGCVAIAAVGLAMYDADRFLAADHYGGFVVGIIVVFTGVRVLRHSALVLMDTMPDAAQMAGVVASAMKVPGVAGVDKAYARKTGFRYHVDIHIEVDPALTVAESHNIAGGVRQRLRLDLDWVADVLVHIEPTAIQSEGEIR